MKLLLIICLGLLLGGCYVAKGSYSGSYGTGNSTLDRWNYERQVRYENSQRNQILYNQRRMEQLHRQQQTNKLIRQQRGGY